MSRTLTITLGIVAAILLMAAGFLAGIMTPQRTLLPYRFRQQVGIFRKNGKSIPKPTDSNAELESRYRAGLDESLRLIVALGSDALPLLREKLTSDDPLERHLSLYCLVEIANHPTFNAEYGYRCCRPISWEDLRTIEAGYVNLIGDPDEGVQDLALWCCGYSGDGLTLRVLRSIVLGNVNPEVNGVLKGRQIDQRLRGLAARSVTRMRGGIGVDAMAAVLLSGNGDTLARRLAAYEVASKVAELFRNRSISGPEELKPQWRDALIAALNDTCDDVIFSAITSLQIGSCGASFIGPLLHEAFTRLFDGQTVNWNRAYCLVNFAVRFGEKSFFPYLARSVLNPTKEEREMCVRLTTYWVGMPDSEAAQILPMPPEGAFKYLQQWYSDNEGLLYWSEKEMRFVRKGPPK